MNYGCPNLACKNYSKTDFIIKNGRFKRKSDSRYVQKFKCTYCGKQFSKATFTLEKYQKKRRVNSRVFELLASGVSMRRTAKLVRVDKKTIQRKLKYLGKKSKLKHDQFLKKLAKSKVDHMQLDDLISIEHTKLKPVSISIAVDAKRRYVLGVEVSRIAAFGHLAQISRRKYGYRKSEHKQSLDKLFKTITPVVDKNALVESDEHNLYPEFVESYLPSTKYKQYKGARGCVAGQGELKKLNYDPLFSINHTCAMFRANINRLIRKTWCTTKDLEQLTNHIYIFVNYYNKMLVQDQKT